PDPTGGVNKLTTSYTLDNDGNVTAVATPGINSPIPLVTSYVFNAVGQQTEEEWLDGAPAGGSGNVFHTIQTYYNTLGETVGVVETDTTTALHAANPSSCTDYEYAYDFDGRLTSSRMAPGDIPQTPTAAHPYVATALTELDYTYYPNGTMETVSDKSDLSSLSGNAATTTYVYNGLDQVTSISQSGSGATAKEAAFGYDNNGEVQTETYSATSQVAVGSYGYDDDGRLTSLSYTHGGNAITTGGTGTPAVSYAWQYDHAGNVTQQVSADGTDNYTTDSANQLIGASLTSEGYSYDAFRSKRVRIDDRKAETKSGVVHNTLGP
ncbi:MAG: hypothetical protein ACLPM3_15065, partial [Terracidiphilus sp.]